MYFQIFIFILLTKVTNRLCLSDVSSNLVAIDSAVNQLSSSVGKKKDKPLIQCYEDIDCFSRDGPLKHLGLLPESPDKINTRFFAFNHSTPNSSHEVKTKDNETFETIISNQSLVIIIHGFANDAKKPELIAIKDSLFRYANMANVIMVDWNRGAIAPFYNLAVTNTQLVGRQIAILVDELQRKRSIDPSFVHLIGFSLGAQVSHFAGEYFFFKFRQRLGRITALDAAAPLFEGYEGSHINIRDALFVDAIHTSGGNNILKGELGFTSPVGHIDFYPNNGSQQPCCQNHFIIEFCDHNSALIYFESSLRAIFNCSLIAYKCDSWTQFSFGDCTDRRGSAIMGYLSVLSESRGTHYLKTSDSFPFCWDNKFIDRQMGIKQIRKFKRKPKKRRKTLKPEKIFSALNIFKINS